MIFKSYVKLPEGNPYYINDRGNHLILSCSTSWSVAGLGLHSGFQLSAESCALCLTKIAEIVEIGVKYILIYVIVV